MRSPFRGISELFGYDLRPIRKSDRAEHILARMLTNFPVDLCIDVGANQGQWATETRRSGFKGDIISCEPGAGAFAALHKASGNDPRWYIVPTALGAANTEAALKTFGGKGDLNSLREPAAPEDAGAFKHIKVVGEETVEVRTLDAVLDEMGIASDRPMILKSDTQGYDLEVLLGAKQRLGQCIGLVLEMNCLRIYDGAPDHREMADFVYDAGFELYGISPVTRDKDTRLIEYDGFFVRRS